MDVNSFCEAPLGVLRRVAGNVPSAPDVYFITKNCISFGSRPLRDVIFEWKEQPKLSVVLNKTYLQINDNTWRIRNDNGNRVYLNDTFVQKQTSTEIISGDQIRFGFKESLHLIYLFQLYCAEHPATVFESKFYLEFTLINFETKAQDCNRNCARLLGELENVQREIRKKREFFERRRPIAAFQLMSSNVTGAPPFYFLEKLNALIGKSLNCDIIIDSDECSLWEAVVKEDTNHQWKITNESFIHRHFINERYFKLGETLVLESQDRIRLGGTEKFDVIYEFKLYSTHVPSADMQLYVEHSLQKFQNEANNTCVHLQSDLEKFQETAKIIDNTRKQIKLKLEKINATISTEKAAEKVKRTMETNVGGNKKIKTEMLGDGSQCAADKVEKTKENVSEGIKEIKKELGDESESTTATVKQEEAVINKVKVVIKTEAVEEDDVEISIKKEFPEY